MKGCKSFIFASLQFFEIWQKAFLRFSGSLLIAALGPSTIDELVAAGTQVSATAMRNPLKNNDLLRCKRAHWRLHSNCLTKSAKIERSAPLQKHFHLGSG
jgi:hypothetical protein